jgi:3-oxoacyl-[acyl-carrier-protein] synthase-3
MIERADLLGFGHYLPPDRLTNTELSQRLGIGPEWIEARTGIVERRVGTAGTVPMAVLASQRALDDAGVSAAELSVIVLATTTPDQIVPASASSVQGALGSTGAAFDINAACSGFIYALVTATHLLGSIGGIGLVIGADSLTRITDPSDKATAILMGDGAGAVVVVPSRGPGGLLGYDLGGDGALEPLLRAPNGGTMQMQGAAVFRHAVDSGSACTLRALESAGCTTADVDHFVPHQANGRIISAMARRLDFPTAKVHNTIAHVGNTSAASIPVSLSMARDSNELLSGELVAMTAFGAGMTWASAVWQL